MSKYTSRITKKHATSAHKVAKNQTMSNNQSSKIKLPLPKEKYRYLRKLMLRHFLHSCYNIPARKEKDLTSKMGLNLAKNLREKKRDVFTQ